MQFIVANKLGEVAVGIDVSNVIEAQRYCLHTRLHAAQRSGSCEHLTTEPAVSEALVLEYPRLKSKNALLWCALKMGLRATHFQSATEWIKLTSSISGKYPGYITLPLGTN